MSDLALCSTFEDKPSSLPESIQEHATSVLDSASDCDSFAGDGPLGCDDLLDVDQDDINVEFTIPSTVYMISSSYSAHLSVDTDPLDCSDDISTGSWASSTTPTFLPREGSQTSFVDSVSQMDESRIKLLHSMERACESRRALKRRRLCAETGTLLNCLDQSLASFTQIYDRLQGDFELTF